LKTKREEKDALNKNDEAFKQWDWWTAKFAAAANIPFLLLQLPQILLNARNLMAGNKTALLAVSWLVSVLSPFLVYFPHFVEYVTSEFKSLVKFVAGHPYWVAGKPLTSFLLCQEEGDRSNDSSMSGSDNHIRSDYTASDGRSHAIPLLCSNLCSRWCWCYLQFSQLLWHASSCNLAFLGRLHHSWRTFCPSPGSVYDSFLVLCGSNIS